MRILVSGGAGFLGSHLIDELLAAGHSVICVDNFFTGDKSNLEHHFVNSKLEIIRHDITFPLYLEVDQIFNDRKSNYMKLALCLVFVKI